MGAAVALVWARLKGPLASLGRAALGHPGVALLTVALVLAVTYGWAQKARLDRLEGQQLAAKLEAAETERKALMARLDALEPQLEQRRAEAARLSAELGRLQGRVATLDRDLADAQAKRAAVAREAAALTTRPIEEVRDAFKALGYQPVPGPRPEPGAR